MGGVEGEREESKREGWEVLKGRGKKGRGKDGRC
jgi:hypothetical protein